MQNAQPCSRSLNIFYSLTNSAQKLKRWKQAILVSHEPDARRQICDLELYERGLTLLKGFP